MNCMKCKKYLSSYIDDELLPQQRLEVEEHLKKCSICRTKLEALQSLSNRLKNLPRIEGDLTERNRLISTLHEKISGELLSIPVPVKSLWKKYALAGAFIVVLVIAVSVILKTPNESQPPFILNSPGQGEEIVAGPLEDQIIEHMIRVLEFERIHAREYEAFSEPVLGIYAMEPAPPIEGGNTPEGGDYPVSSG